MKPNQVDEQQAITTSSHHEGGTPRTERRCTQAATWVASWQKS